MIFIKLRLDTSGKFVFVNAEKIADIVPFNGDKGSAISYDSSEYNFIVQELPGQILEKIRAEEERQNTLIEVVSGENIDRVQCELLEEMKGMEDYLAEDEVLIKEALVDARKVQEYLWQELSLNNDGVFNPEIWAYVFQKRCDKIKEINPENLNAIVELRKRVLQQAALSIVAMKVLSKSIDKA